jgi:hypothetical protein
MGSNLDLHLSQPMRWVERLILAASFVACATAAIAQGQLPDALGRQLLNGCWELGEPTTTLCFDGLERVSAWGRSGERVAHGTFALLRERLFFDLSPESNPAKETYPSCAIDIRSGSELILETSETFSLSGCRHWDIVPDAIRTVGLNGAVAKRVDYSWSSDWHEVQASTRIGPLLRGCWRDLKSDARTLCFDDGDRKVTFSFFSFWKGFVDEEGVTHPPGGEGHESVGTFELSGGAIELFTDARNTALYYRCEVYFSSEDALRLSSCEAPQYTLEGGLTDPRPAESIFLGRLNQ